MADQNPDFIPDDESPQGSQQSAPVDFIPDSEAPTEEQDQSSDKLKNSAKIAVGSSEAALRGATLGMSDVVLSKLDPFLAKLGGKDLTQEQALKNIEARKESDLGAPVDQNGEPIISGKILHGIESGAASMIPLAASDAALGSLGINAKIAALPRWSKVGANAIKAGLETGLLLQGGDELSKAMLGQGDPNAPVASALSHMGAAGLMGTLTGGLFGVTGVGLAKIGDTRIGNKLSQFAEDFGNRLNFRKANPDIAEAVTNEISDFYNSTAAAGSETWGPSGIKSQAIAKLVPEQMTEEISKQSQKIANTLQNKISEMVADGETYPARFTKKLMGMTNEWMETATNPQATPFDVFNATQRLKQKLQEYAKFEKQIPKISQEYGFVNAAKELQHGLIDNLEDSNVWGKAGDLQRGINKAFSNFLPSLKDMNKSFTKVVLGDHVVDPDMIRTYVNQVAKEKGLVKQTKLGNFIDSAEKYRKEISNLHENLGVDNPIPPSSLNATKATLKKGSPSYGEKAADFMIDKMPAKVGAGTIIGTAGALSGAAGIFGSKEAVNRLPGLSEAIGKPITGYGEQAIMKVLGSGAYRGMAEGLAHARNVDRGAQKINRSIESLFKASESRAVDEYATEKDREKLKNFIEKGGVTQQMQNQLHHQQKTQQNVAPKGFAEGGQVEAPVKPEINEQEGNLGDIYPEQNTLLEAAKGRVYNYLNGLRPQENAAKFPFDPKPDQKMQEKKYNRAIDIANQPLKILNSVKDGSITPEELKHFGSMYPEIHNHLAKEITKRISEKQLDDEKPNHKTRQGLSLFLGAPVDSSFTPQAIMAAQNVFAQQKAAKQPIAPQGKKGSTSKMGEMSKQFKTSEQAAQSRQIQDR